jgi:hypothetical protein
MEDVKDITNATSITGDDEVQRNEKEISSETEETSIDGEEKAISGSQVKEAHDAVQSGDDPNIVNWDGPEDPDMALNWPVTKKWTMTILLSTLTLLTYV